MTDLQCCWRRRTRWHCALLSLLMTVTSSAAADLTDQQARGRQIYQNGTTASGAPITASVGGSPAPLSAEFLPCAGCHGVDGLGRPEGGVNPPNITWAVLTTAYGHDHPYGRSHPPFDAQSIGRAVTMGVDPAGNALDPAMPRYVIAADDLADLIAYLETIAADLDPGLKGDAIRVGVPLPASGPLEAVAEAVRAVLKAVFEDVNQGGGIHGRRIDLVVGEFDERAAEVDGDIADPFAAEPVFALVSGFVPGMESRLAATTERERVPWIGPFTQSPDPGDGAHHYTFYLLGGLREQTRVLARHAARLAPGAARLAIVHELGPEFEASVAAVKRDIGEGSIAANLVAMPYEAPYLDATDAAQFLRSGQATSVLFLGRAEDLKRLAEALSRVDWHPALLLPGVFAGKPMFDVPSGYPGGVAIGYSSVPADHSPRGVRDFERLHAAHGLDFRYSVAQISAYVAASVLLEGLKRSGRDLDRERFVRALEGLAGYQSGLMPPISYNARRRIGALGGYVVDLDLDEKRFGASSKWLEIEP